MLIRAGGVCGRFQLQLGRSVISTQCNRAGQQVKYTLALERHGSRLFPVISQCVCVRLLHPDEPVTQIVYNKSLESRQNNHVIMGFSLGQRGLCINFGARVSYMRRMALGNERIWLQQKKVSIEKSLLAEQIQTQILAFSWLQSTAFVISSYCQLLF